MEREDLQLRGEVDLAQADPVGGAEDGGREVEDARDPGGDEPVADLLRRRRGRGDDPDAGVAVVDDVLEVVDAAHLDLLAVATGGDLLPHPRRIGVEQADDAEAARGETAVVGQRVPEVSDADDHDGPVLGQAELAGDLVDEVVGVVADAAGAVGPEVGEVLAQLRARDAARGGELLARHGRDARIDEAREHPVVDREAGHRGLRDTASRCVASAGQRHETPRGCGVVDPVRVGSRERTHKVASGRSST